jgi:hypothetical protein
MNNPPSSSKDLMKKVNNQQKNPCKIYNMGDLSLVPLMDYISTIESTFGITAKKEMLP